MTRRAAFAGAAALISLVSAAAQSPPKLLRVGYVTLLPRGEQHQAFVKRMAELGYQEGANFAYEFRHIRSFEEYPAAYSELKADRTPLV